MFLFSCCHTECAKDGRDYNLIESISALSHFRDDQHHGSSSEVIESDGASSDDDDTAHEWVATDVNRDESNSHLNLKMQYSGPPLAHMSDSSIHHGLVDITSAVQGMQEQLAVSLTATSSANRTVRSSHTLASCQPTLHTTTNAAAQSTQLSQPMMQSKTAVKPNADFSAATQSTMEPFKHQTTLSSMSCSSKDLSDMARLLSTPRCSSEDLLNSDELILPSGWRQSTEPVHTCHMRSKEDDLEIKLAGIVLVLDGLEREVSVTLSLDGDIAIEKCSQLLARCNQVYGQLSELAGDALERGCGRNVPGAMNVFQLANAEVDRVACLLQMVQQPLD